MTKRVGFLQDGYCNNIGQTKACAMALKWIRRFIFGAATYLLLLNSLFCFFRAENEIHWDQWSDEVIDELRVRRPVECTTHSPYVSINADLPYEIQDQYGMISNINDCPSIHKYVQGSDLGISVHFDYNRDDIIYFGDTNIVESSSLRKGPEYYLRYQCAYKVKPYCDDMYGTITNDDDPVDGVDFEIDSQKWAQLGVRDRIREWDDGFASIRLMGLNMRDLDGSLKSSHGGGDIFGDFNTPTGAMAITAYSRKSKSDVFFEYGKKSSVNDVSDLEESPGVMMLYATACNVYDKKQSWLGCSLDGHVFKSCMYPRENEVTFLSDDKFIQVSPVSFSRDDVDDACQENDDSIFCDLDSILNDFRPEYGQGALLFGNGKEYRCSPLYLAYIELATGDIWYYDKSDNRKWSDSEKDATPIIQPGLPEYSPNDNSICSDVSSDAAAEAREYVFGEMSVKLIDGYFVLLSNHIHMINEDSGFVRIYYRTAPFTRPEKWSKPEATQGVGYGPYILDRYTEILEIDAAEYLQVYHVLSTWNTTLDSGEPYAVMTRPLTLMSTGEFPTWPPVEE
ncbi:MAG: DUF4185 domain-containing protein [Proteobacteria bacterium]|nr:DUF4185 domain-containing protein [Pseudomonadota bacterium]